MMADKRPPQVDYGDLIEKHRATKGDRWVAELSGKLIAEIERACACGDLAYLLALCYPENAFMRDIFTRKTGLALQKTQRQSMRILEDFVGPEAVAAYQQQQEQLRRQREIKRLEFEVRRQWVKAERYGELLADAFIRALVADGYCQLKEQQSGKRTVYFLCNEEGKGYLFRRRVERDYIAHLVEQRAEQQRSAPEQGAGPPVQGLLWA